MEDDVPAEGVAAAPEDDPGLDELPDGFEVEVVPRRPPAPPPAWPPIDVEPDAGDEPRIGGAAAAAAAPVAEACDPEVEATSQRQQGEIYAHRCAGLGFCTPARKCSTHSNRTMLTYRGSSLLLDTERRKLQD